jgi:hypothetical protein
LNELAQLILLLCDLESRSLGFRPSVAGALCARQDYAGAANTKSQIVKFERHQTNHSTLQRNDQGIYKPIPHGLALGINNFFFSYKISLAVWSTTVYFCRSSGSAVSQVLFRWEIYACGVFLGLNAMTVVPFQARSGHYQLDQLGLSENGVQERIPGLKTQTIFLMCHVTCNELG